MDLGKYFGECRANTMRGIEWTAQAIPSALFIVSRLFYASAHGTRQFFIYFRLAWRESKYPMDIRLPAEAGE